MPVALLDGGLGSELELRGLDVPRAPWWSAAALRDYPDEVQSIHIEYAAVGAHYHTSNTFRTQRPSIGDDWEYWARFAVSLLRTSIPPQAKLCASIAPLGHCYTPDAAAPELFGHFDELAAVFRDGGADVLLCETFCSEREVHAASEAALRTGLPTWVALTPGPDGSVLKPSELRRLAKSVVDKGISRLLVNCVAASKMLPYVEAVSDLGAPVGAYANAGDYTEAIGWNAGEDGAKRYLEYAIAWVDAGATVVGGCCGTRPAHIRHLAKHFG